MRRLGAAVLALACITAGCTSGHRHEHVRLSVAPADAIFDRPVQVTVRGLRPGQPATLTATTVDYKHVTWRSSATFRASSTGVVDTRQAPIAGAYRGADPMGIFDRMRPVHGGMLDTTFYGPVHGYAVTVSVIADGHVAARSVVHRLPASASGGRYHRFRHNTDGFDADLYLPRETRGQRPGVLLFGGSEGGLSQYSEAQLLASHGYPAMALAYFDAPGLPRLLHDIPLEYFLKALRALRDTQGVDPRRLVVWGVSRGSEAALLLGAHFPKLVNTVVAAVPSAVVHGAYRAAGAAWTLAGRPLPHVPDSRRAAIPVERIRGHVLTICGGQDFLWPSCNYSDAIVRRMQRHGEGDRVTELTYPMAGHAVGSVLPYVPTVSADLNSLGAYMGGTVAGDVLGRIDAWQHILKLLAGLR